MADTRVYGIPMDNDAAPTTVSLMLMPQRLRKGDVVTIHRLGQSPSTFTLARKNKVMYRECWNLISTHGIGRRVANMPLEVRRSA